MSCECLAWNAGQDYFQCGFFSFRYHMARYTGLLLTRLPENTLKVFQLCWVCSGPLLSMIFVGVGLLGLFRVGYLFRKSRPKVLGLQTVSGGTFHSLHPIHHKSLMPLGPTSSPSLRPLLLLLVVWAPVTYHINSISQ